MQGESSSAESKAPSGGTDHVYKCPNCSRVFSSMRARGGHQIAHRKKRPIRRRHKFPPNISPILAAVLAHHISSDDEKPPAAPKGAETQPTQTPEKAVQPAVNEQKNESVTNQENDAVQANPRAKNGCSQRHPSKRSVREKHQQQPRTRDFLSGWNPIPNVADGAGPSQRSTEDGTLDLFTGVSDDESDDLDLELELRSKNAERVDLKLKLGF